MSVSEGLSPREIADARERSIETIRTQIKQIITKIGLSTSNALIAHINSLKM